MEGMVRLMLDTRCGIGDVGAGKGGRVRRRGGQTGVGSVDEDELSAPVRCEYRFSGLGLVLDVQATDSTLTIFRGSCGLSSNTRSRCIARDLTRATTSKVIFAVDQFHFRVSSSSRMRGLRLLPT